MKQTKREQRAMVEKFALKHIKKEDIKIGFRFYLRADADLTSALLALLDTVPAHQKLYPESYVDKIVKLVNGGK